MNDLISPRYQMKLVKEVSEAIWEEYKTYKDVNFYISKWHVVQENWNDYLENFSVVKRDSGDIDLLPTLHGMPGEIILQIAVDLGVETPDFIPTVATFKNEIKSDYKTAYSTFEKAYKQIEVHPDVAIGLANSALESIIKEILKDERVNNKIKGTETLYDLASAILKEFKMFPSSDCPQEIKTIGSSMLSLSQAIEGLRSTGTTFHGRTDDDFLVSDPLYTYVVVNSVSTVGLFLNSFYKRKFPQAVANISDPDDDLPF